MATIGATLDLSLARRQAQNRQGHHYEKDDSEQPGQPFNGDESIGIYGRPLIQVAGGCL